MRDMVFFILQALFVALIAFLFAGMLQKRNRIVVSASIFILILAYGTVTYGIKGDKNAMISVPDSVCMYIDGDRDQGELEYIDLQTNVKTYHISVSEKYLYGNAYAYFTGDIWDSLRKPTVHVNGEDCKVDIDGGFPARYYHFRIDDIVPREKYRIYVRCGKNNDYMNVFFEY